MVRFQLKNGRYQVPQQTKFSRYVKDGRNNEKDAALEDLHYNELPDTHGSYAALILHPNWKSKRNEVIERDQYKCVICSSSKELQVHHRQYHFIIAAKKFKAPWDYPGHLLITLCSSCLARGHSKFKVPSINI